MTCATHEELLEQPLRPDVARHLVDCSRCRAQQRQLEWTGASSALDTDTPANEATYGEGEVRYEPIRLIGTGPRGTVHAAFDRVLERRVALKNRPQGWGDAAREHVAGSMGLRHFHLAQVYDIRHGSVSRELIEGRTFSEVLADAPHPSQLVTWFCQLASAIEALHRHGIAHGSVKPENVWVTPGGRLVLTDGGLGGGLPAGSPLLAPELAPGQASPAGDWYAAGVLFEPSGLGGLCQRMRSPAPEERPGPTEVMGTLLAYRDATRRGDTRYRDLGLLGVGGMGEVRRVYDSVLNREVAIKVMAASQAGKEASFERFLCEAQITAQLQHPGIVPVHDLAIQPDGSVYFTMRKFEGRTLTKVIDELHASSRDGWATSPSGWTLVRLVDAFHRVCEAVAYAHAKGVVHRDLKPGNIMLDDFGEVLVVDWGIAKLVDEDAQHSGAAFVSLTSGGGHTRPGAAAGTPGYMPQEQARGRLDEIGPHSDVFALGAVLYQILTGVGPFEGGDTADMLEAPGRAGYAPIARLRPDAPGELAAIAARALSPRPTDRYENAAHLAKEIEAWQAGEPVSAYDYTRFEHLVRWVRPRVSSLLVGSALLLTMGIAGGAAVVVAEAQRRHQESHAQVLVEKAQLALLGGDRISAAVYAAGSVAEADRPEGRALLARIDRAWMPALLHRDDRVCPGLTVREAPLRAECPRAAPRPEPQFVEVVRCDEGLTVARDTAGSLYGWRPGEAPAALNIKTHHAAQIACAPGGKRLAIAAGDEVEVWEIAPRPLQTHLLGGHTEPVITVAWSGDGALLASGASDGEVRLWRAERGREGEEVVMLPGHEHVLRVAFAPESKVLGTATRSGVRLWDVGAAPRASELNAVVEVVSLAWTPDARLLAVDRHGGTTLFDVERGERLDRWQAQAVATSPTGAVAFGREDGTVVVFDAERRPAPYGRIDNQTAVRAVAWLGNTLLTGDDQGAVRAWSGETGAFRGDWLDRGDPVAAISSTPRSGEVLVRTRSGGLALVGRRTYRFLGEGLAAALSPDGKRAAVGRNDGALELVHLASGSIRRLGRDEHPIAGLAFSPDGTLLATAGEDQTVRMWTLDDGIERTRLIAHARGATDVAFSPDGSILASSGGDGRVLLWQTDAARAPSRTLLDRSLGRFGASLHGANLTFERRAGP